MKTQVNMISLNSDFGRFGARRYLITDRCKHGMNPEWCHFCKGGNPTYPFSRFPADYRIPQNTPKKYALPAGDQSLAPSYTPLYCTMEELYQRAGIRTIRLGTSSRFLSSTEKQDYQKLLESVRANWKKRYPSEAKKPKIEYENDLGGDQAIDDEHEDSNSILDVLHVREAAGVLAKDGNGLFGEEIRKVYQRCFCLEGDGWRLGADYGAGRG